MNLKTNLALVGLAMLALVAMTPTATATAGSTEDSLVKANIVEVCVVDLNDVGSIFGAGGNSAWCGKHHNSWATVEVIGLCLVKSSGDDCQ